MIALFGALGGLLGAGLTVGLLAQAKARELEARGTLLTEALRGQATAFQLLLAVRGETLREQLIRAALIEAPGTAERAAEAMLRNGYGLTPDALARLQRLATALG